jgi:hypothetical protein
MAKSSMMIPITEFSSAAEEYHLQIYLDQFIKPTPSVAI